MIRWKKLDSILVRPFLGMSFFRQMWIRIATTKIMNPITNPPTKQIAAISVNKPPGWGDPNMFFSRHHQDQDVSTIPEVAKIKAKE